MEKLFFYVKSLEDIQTQLRCCPNSKVQLPTIEEVIYKLNFYLKEAENEYTELMRGY